MTALIEYIQNRAHLEAVGQFDKFGAYEFQDKSEMLSDMGNFNPSDIWELYLTWYNPVLHYKIDKEQPDYITTAFCSLINMHYCS